MYWSEKTRNIILIVLAVCLIGITVAYATLSQNLNISGVAKVEKTSWNIHFTKVLTPKAEGYAEGGKATLNSDSTVLTVSEGILKVPGDTITYVFDVINEGDLDAEVETVLTTIDSCKASDNTTDVTMYCDKIKYDLVYQDTKEAVKKNDQLLKGESKTLNLIITYDKNKELTSLPNTEIVLDNINSTINYTMIQKSSGSTDIPTVSEPVSFETDDWTTIAKAVKSGTYPYDVGDEKTITVAEHINNCSSYSGSSDTYKCNSEKIKNKDVIVRVANTCACSIGEISETACGFVLEFKDILENHNMNYANSSQTYGTNVGGWPASEMRRYINDVLYNSLPNDLKNVIIDTKVVSSCGSNDSSNFNSNDKMYLLSSMEVYGTNANNDTLSSETRQLDIYKKNGVELYNYTNAKKEYNGTVSKFWLRSAYSRYFDTFYQVDTYGYGSYDTSHYTLGVSPAFRIG